MITFWFTGFPFDEPVSYWRVLQRRAIRISKFNPEQPLQPPDEHLEYSQLARSYEAHRHRMPAHGRRRSLRTTTPKKGTIAASLQHRPDSQRMCTGSAPPASGGR